MLSITRGKAARIYSVVRHTLYQVELLSVHLDKEEAKTAWESARHRYPKHIADEIELQHPLLEIKADQ